jgi:septum formation topological specificity factor MinE
MEAKNINTLRSEILRVLVKWIQVGDCCEPHVSFRPVSRLAG